jgi:oligosaccharide repeat unit polymerase
LVLLFILVAMLPVIYRLMTNTFDTFEAENVAILFYSLYSLSVPLHVLLSPEVSTLQLNLVTKAFGLCLVGLLFFLVGYHNRLGSNVARMFPPLPRRWDQRTTKTTSHIYLLLGIALFLGLISIVGVSTYFQSGYPGRALLKREVGLLELGLYIIQLGLVLYIFFYSLAKRRPPLGVIAAYALYVLLVMKIGIRRPLLGLLLASFAAWHYLVKKISFRQAAVIAMVFGLALVLFAFVRQIIASQGFIAGIEYFIKNFSWAWFDLSQTELGAPFKNLLDILAFVPDHGGYLYGLSYWQSVENLLPRFVYPSRPPTLSEWYTNAFFPEEFVQAGGNMGFFIISEAYINWDIVGVMVVMFCWGILLKAFYAYMKRDLPNTSALFLYSVSLAWIVFAMRIDFAAALKGFLVTAFLPAMLAIILIITKLRPVRS